VAQPLPAGVALEPAPFAAALAEARRRAAEAGVRGPALTPYLLARLAEVTGGQTLKANQALIVSNALLAARIARALPPGG
jgi:pseudouridine-5'-phosphate glycosidase